MSNEAWISLGAYTDDWGAQVPVGLPLRDLRLHTTVLGTTGSGKSTLSRNLALQAFMLGASVVVIEPHGDLVLDPQEGILAALPPDTLDRVAVLDLNSPWPPQINLATAGLGAGLTVAVKTAMSCIAVVEGAGFEQAVKMREILEHALSILVSVFGENASMVGLQRFLTDAAFRDSVLARAGDEAGESLSYWRRLIERWQSKHKGRSGGATGEEDMDVPLRRVGKFMRDDRFRRSLSLPAILPGHDLQIAPLMNANEPTMLLVPLQSAKLGEEAKRVFGTLFMQMVINTFMSRADQDAADRRTTLIIVDEFADMAGTEIGQIVNKLLAQARKYGAAVVLATQFLDQLDGKVRLEVENNTNNKIMLRVAGESDAKLAARLLGGDITPNDVLAIERHCGYARTMARGQSQPPYYFQNLPPISALPSRTAGVGRAAPPAPNLPARLQELHLTAASDAGKAVAMLREMKEAEFRGAVQAQKEQQAQMAAALLADPELEPDRVKRALRISRARFGLPWWFYEALYRRLRF